MANTTKMFEAEIQTAETYLSKVYVEAYTIDAAREKIKAEDYYTSRRRNTGTINMDIISLNERERPAKVTFQNHGDSK